MCVNEDDMADWWNSAMAYQTIACYKTVHIFVCSFIGSLKIIVMETLVFPSLFGILQSADHLLCFGIDSAYQYFS
jgi:hypothetical protein